MVSFDILQNILKENRSVDDNRNIYEWLKRKTDVFKNLSFNTVIDIIDNGKIIEKHRNEIIIRQGDIGDSFYVMLKGSASIFIKAEMNTIQTEEIIENLNFKKSPKAQQSNRMVSSIANKLHRESPKPVKDNDRKLLGEYAGKCGEGDCFGELALIQIECIRNASIISDENVFLIAISREIFNRSLRSLAESVYQEKVNFVNKCFLFKSWMPRLKYQVAMSLVKETFYFDQKLIVQGQESSGLIFLKKGEAKTIIDIKQHSNQFNHLLATQRNDESIIKDFMPNSKVDNHQNASLTKELTKNIKTDEYEVSIVGENYIIGDIEFCFNMENNIFTVIATKKCEVFILNQRHLERMITPKRNVTTLNFLQDLASLKLNIYYNRCSIISELPLLRYLIEEINKSNELETSPVVIKSAIKKSNFQPLFPPGPIIDLYGPGSVFFRNKSKRTAIEAKLTKQDRSNHFQNWKSRQNVTISDVIPVSKTPQLNEYFGNVRKSINSLSARKNISTDWETNSEHLENLESRLNTWMLNIPVQTRSYSDLSSNFTILKLPRFKSQLPYRSPRLINVKDEKKNDNNMVDRQNKGRKSEIQALEKKTLENLSIQYTALDYRRLKKEMYLKEKKLAVFRLTNVI